MPWKRQGGINDQEDSTEHEAREEAAANHTVTVGDIGAQSYQKKGVGICPHSCVVTSKQKPTSEEQQACNRIQGSFSV